MPELPEVECVRRTLARRIVGRRITSVRVSRSDVIHGSAAPANLLVDDAVQDVLRHGKQLALVGQQGGCLAVHLGMSGQLCLVPRPTERPQASTGSVQDASLPPHTHVLWSLNDGSAVRFTDPRRFGGLWPFADRPSLEQRWAKLGPDALTIKPAELGHALSRTKRCIKAALLDQSLIAGLGNIYVDELLYQARLHPLMPANEIASDACPGLVRQMRALLTNAINRGGSSLRDYVDAENQQGNQQSFHRVYGRAGKPCHRRSCRGQIVTDLIAGRTTAWCPRCQSL